MGIETMYDRIKRLRESQGLSQEDLAKKCGYSDRSTISKIEKGERNLPGSKIQVIAKALGVKPSYLMDGDQTADDSENTQTKITDQELKFALFDGDKEITDAQLDEVKRFAKFIKERDKNEQ